MEEVILKWKKTPGPMTYKTEAKIKEVNKNGSKAPKSGYADEIETHGREVPAVGKY
jgi:hypothetical protein